MCRQWVDILGHHTECGPQSRLQKLVLLGQRPVVLAVKRQTWTPFLGGNATEDDEHYCWLESLECIEFMGL
jgi:hypothetical protein